MTIVEDIQAERERIAALHVDLADERARFVDASQADAAELASLRVEAERIEAQIAVAKIDADHQERAIGITPQPLPVLPAGPTAPATPAGPAKE